MSDRATPSAGKTLAMMAGGARIAAIIPTTLGEVFALAEMVFAGDLAPESVKKPQQLTIIFMKGMEIGLPPMAAMECIGVINGKACLHSDGIPSLLWAHGFKIRERYVQPGDLNTCVAHCEITRPDGSIYVFEYSAQDAKDNGLWKTEASKSPWWLYKKRMLRMRCRGWLARDCASDVLKGIPIYEEQADIELSKEEYKEVPASKPLLDVPDEIKQDLAPPPTVNAHVSEAENNQDQPIINIEQYLQALKDNLTASFTAGDHKSFQETWDGHVELFEAGRISRSDHNKAEEVHDTLKKHLDLMPSKAAAELPLGDPTFPLDRQDPKPYVDKTFHPKGKKGR